ncbi:Tricorn protease-interacting factor F2 [uncultured archaeon]|nr:Tricorn protease-interacting factor F2 [uncultured archaeon]
MAVKHDTLGTNVIPKRYFVEFDTSLKTFKFGGKEKIEVAVSEPTYRIELNAAELTIKEAIVESRGVAQKATVSLDKKNERAILRIKSKVRGDVTISLCFAGVNNDKMYGFYKSKYLAGGKVCYLLSTQFEPADARHAFPCFDEPAFKAKFDVSVVADAGLECVSNMPIRNEELLKRGRKRISFFTTPRMSTYLVYLGVGDFDRVEGKLGKLKISVLTTKGKKNLAVLALDYAKKFVKHHENYFGIKYALPKLDLLAIPDFAAGAMENWGAITFRETDILGDEGSAVASKQGIAITIAHELAHQWFGDLVTMEWWDDLWLNESFATYMSYKAIQAVIPEWDMMTQYLNDEVGGALGADQLKSTQPISTRVNDPEEMNEAFNPEITYAKGGAVLEMIEDYVGSRVFRNGLHEFLNAHKFGNATKYDLWRSIDDASEKAGKRTLVEKMAAKWIEKPGYPVVVVSRSEKGFALRQNRFCISAEDKASSDWHIPVHYITDRKSEGKFLMAGSTHSINSADVAEAEWVKLNIGQKGFYRIRYESEMLDKLGEAIRDGRLSSIDAWGIEGDLFSFVRSGRFVVDDYLRFVRKYCFDCGYPADSRILAHLGWLHNMLYNTPLVDSAREPLVSYSRGLLKRLGVERKRGEKNECALLRSSALLNL